MTVTVLRSGFQSGALVKFCGQGATPSSLTSIKITVVAPAFENYGPCVVEVDNPDGGRSPESVAFNYYEPLPSVTPASAAGGASHTVPGGSGGTQDDVFVAGSDSNLHHTFHTDFSPTWSSWENLGGVLTSAPSAVSRGSQNRIDVFTRGSHNALWHKWWTGSSWSGWESLGGDLTSASVVTSWAAGRLDVFVRGTDNQMWWHRFFADRDEKGAQPAGDHQELHLALPLLREAEAATGEHRPTSPGFDHGRAADARLRLPGDPVLPAALQAVEDAGREVGLATVQRDRGCDRAVSFVEHDQVGPQRGRHVDGRGRDDSRR